MWTQPKTNWTMNDMINCDDYNRIRNNIEYLMNIEKIVLNKTFTTVLEREQTYNDYAFCETWNVLENAVEELIQPFYPTVSVGNKKIYKAGDYYIDYKELNRLEKATVTIRQLLETERQKLPFTLGNYGGVKI